MAGSLGGWLVIEQQLFPAPVPAPGKVVSAGRKRTLRNNALLARGVHPATGQALIYVGARCKGCVHYFRQAGVAGVYDKCELTAARGPATGIRKTWQACTLWKGADNE